MSEFRFVEVMQLLINHGVNLSYPKPLVQKFPKMRKFKMDHNYLELPRQIIARNDCALTANCYFSLDFEMILESALLVVDSSDRYVLDSTMVLRA